MGGLSCDWNSAGMKNDALVRIYTKPLFDLAVESKQIDAIAAELEVLQQLFEQVPQLEEYLDSPNISNADKLELLKKAYDKAWSDYFDRFLGLVLRKGRQEILPFALEAFTSYWDEYRSRIDVKVISAVELTDRQKTALTRKLSDRTGKTVELECAIDPHVMGGIRVQIGHQLVDATITGKLAALREELLG
jgi:F-type H+-transporting ATPase subunit delta